MENHLPTDKPGGACYQNFHQAPFESVLKGLVLEMETPHNVPS
jgi:hypothetical protein